MTTTLTQAQPQPQDLYGRRVAARLSAGSEQLPHDISERLRAARMRAIAQRKREITVPVRAYVLAGAQGGDDRPSLWGRLASALPVVMLAAGLVAINLVQNEIRAAEVAEVDAALLTDDLPPAAYADPGFVEFLKSDH